MNNTSLYEFKSFIIDLKRDLIATLQSLQNINQMENLDTASIDTALFNFKHQTSNFKNKLQVLLKSLERPDGRSEGRPDGISEGSPAGISEGRPEEEY